MATGYGKLETSLSEKSIDFCAKSKHENYLGLVTAEENDILRVLPDYKEKWHGIKYFYEEQMTQSEAEAIFSFFRKELIFG